jgi:hypothetical protein
MKRFWISWVSTEEDYRPLHDPPNEAILGWWCSGEDAGGRAILVAWVQARHMALAVLAIAEDWPETKQQKEWRFDDEVPMSWRPTDRFPLEPWMKKRVGTAATKHRKGRKL